MSLFDFVLLLIAGACWTWGIYALFDEDMLLERPGELLRKRLPWWIRKPLFDCPPCMASVHGLAISAVYYDFHIVPMVFYVGCLCGLNFSIKSIIYPKYD